MKTTALDSKPEQPLSNDSSRARAGRLAPATPSPVACSAFSYRDSSENLNESSGAITCTSPRCTSIDQCNQQYSIYALTDSSGNVSERYAYTAYGQPTFLNASATVQTSSAAGNRYTYTAREWDQTIGLHHFRARWMSGVSGRFLGRDPIGSIELTHLYEYAEARPAFYNDPTGLISVINTSPVVNQGNKSCGVDKSASWIFELSASASTLCPSTGVGYIVQKVNVSCRRNACDATGNCNIEGPIDSATYYEVWKVSGSSTIWDFAKPDKITDTAFTPSSPANTCGSYTQHGSIRFYCSDAVKADRPKAVSRCGFTLAEAKQIVEILQDSMICQNFGRRMKVPTELHIVHSLGFGDVAPVIDRILTQRVRHHD